MHPTRRTEPITTGATIAAALTDGAHWKVEKIHVPSQASYGPLAEPNMHMFERVHQPHNELRVQPLHDDWVEQHEVAE